MLIRTKIRDTRYKTSTDWGKFTLAVFVWAVHQLSTDTMQRVLVLTLLCGLVASTPLWLRPDRPPPAKSLRAPEDYLLPTNILPTEYMISLIPYLDNAPVGKANFTFDGEVTMQFTVQTATNLITMHAFDMTIDEATIKVKDGDTELVIASVSGIDDTDMHFYTITLESELPASTDKIYSIEMKYLGNLNELDLEGFYRSGYVEADIQKWMGVTQFEQTGARRAFPCLDQPDFKAYFTIQIAHSPIQNVLCNMPLASDDELVTGITGIEDWRWSKFDKTTVKMPTYLVAFTVSEFNSITLPSDEKYKVWARSELAIQGKVAIGVSPRIVNYMETFTGHDYSMPKIDQIAIPDFSAGAMENWGLITYRESSLLFEDGVSGSSNRQRIEAVVAHELAHQWFGNIVTTKWWDNIWLNEGFATYFESFALGNVETTWLMESQFVHQDMHRVMEVDGLPSTHPLQIIGVGSPDSASAAFDTISYSKGGCIVRFMVNLLGEKHFKAGINEYLTLREFDVAVPDDLWTSLANHIEDGILPRDISFDTVMNTWLTNAGYPVVTFTRNYDEQKSATVSQKRFLTSRVEGEEYNEQWYIPLTWSSHVNPEFENLQIKQWLSPDTDVSLSGIADGWMILNNKQIGYYRVNYDDENWKMLATALHEQMHDIHVINRAQLMDDSLALARGGELDYTLALDTTGYLMHEPEYHPWAVGLESLGYINDRLNTDEDSRTPFSSYMIMLLGPAYDVVNGFTITEDDSHVMRYKRSLILSWACEQGLDECNSEAKSLFTEWMENPDTNPIAPDLKSVVYCSGMQQGGQAEYDFLFEKYSAASDMASEQSTILTALGCASSKELLKQYLDESIKPVSKIRPQDARSVHTAVYNNPLGIGVQVALDWIIANWETCVNVYSGSYNVGRGFTGVAGKCNTQAQRDQLQDLYEAQSGSEGTMEPTLLKQVGDAIKMVDENLVWLTAHKNHVVSYFQSKINSGASFSTVSPILLIATFALSSLISKF